MLNILCFGALLLRQNINTLSNIKMKIVSNMNDDIIPDKRNLNFKRLVALHEAGHVLIIRKFPEYFNLEKVTMNANTAGSGGYTLFTLKDSYNTYPTKEFLMARIMAAMGGHAAELIHSNVNFKDGFQMNYSRVSTGASSDLIKATRLANNYIELFDTNVSNDEYLYESRKKEILDECLEKTLSILKFNHIELQTLRNKILTQRTISFS